MIASSRSGWRRHLLKWIALGALITVGVIGGIVVYERQHNPFVRAMTGGNLSSASEPVTVNMGDVTLQIPRNYFMELPAYGECQPGKKVLQSLLLVFLPDFGPITEGRNREEFTSQHPKGAGHSMLVMIEYKGCSMTGTAYAQFQYNHLLPLPGQDGAITEAEFGYRRFGDPPKYSMTGNDNLFRGALDNPEDFTQCSMAYPGHYPICNRQRMIGNDIVLKYGVSREYFHEINEIERKLVEFLNKFRTSGPEFKVIE
jgi:hypothetical protein